MKGKFIVFEGGDKSGKSTQIKLLQKYLKKKGHKVLLTREPGGKGSVIAEKIRKIILNKRHKEMDKRAELLLFLASRAQHVMETVKPALEQGKIILCDRFDASTYAYQAAARNLDPEVIKYVNNWAKYGLEPDYSIYLDITPEEAAERRRDEKEDRLDSEAREFHELVRQGYLQQAEENGNWLTVSAVGDIEAIAKQIQAGIDKIL